LILNADSPGCLQLWDRLLDWPGRVVTYSVDGSKLLVEPATFEAYDVCLDGETSFRVRTRIGPAFPEDRVINLQLPGAYNIENALAALTAAHLVGVNADTIIDTWKNLAVSVAASRSVFRDN
jgi:UDP-N-acetylmuramate--alanine ligase